MRKLFPSLLSLAAVFVQQSAAQAVSPPTVAPSSVSEKSPAVPPLAGTLFFSREQRERMDRARVKGSSSTVSTSDIIEAPPPSVLNGFVKRSDGQSAVWVDGRPRFNVQANEVRALQPQDVGGSSQRIKVVVPASNADVPRAALQKTSKNRPVKTTIRRPLVKH